MYVKATICALLWSVSLSIAPSTAGAVDKEPAKATAIFCSGMVSTRPDGAFDLTCRTQEMVVTAEFEDVPSSNTTTQTSINASTSECNEPGDVIEQGFCLE